VDETAAQKLVGLSEQLWVDEAVSSVHFGIDTPWYFHASSL
jgi:hypothetical protein